jgi:hypothetical protein
LAGDLIGALNLRKRQAPEWLSTSSLVAWIIPLAAFAVFLALLASARLAAFIWMVLVAVGLLMMLIQIELRKPNSWLDRRQRDFAGRRAVWMLLHQRAATGGVLQCGALPGSRRDGPQSRSAISRLAGAAGAALRRSPCEKVPVLWSIAWDFRHIHETRLRPGNWRGWSFRTWRLERYLANNPSIASNLSGSDRG